MELRSKKKVSVRFFLQDEVEHNILPVTERKGSKTRVRDRRKASRFLSDRDDDYSSPERIDDCDGSEHISAVKSMALVDESEVSGRDMFGFKTPTRKGNLSQKVRESLDLRSPRTITTPIVQDSPKSGRGRPLKTPSTTPVKQDTATPKRGRQFKTPSTTPIKQDTTTPKRGRLCKTPSTTPVKQDTPTRNRGRLRKTSLTREPTTPSRTPLNTPKSAKAKVNEAESKTPYSVRRQFQEKLSKKALAEELGCSSDSDYSLSNSDEESDSCSDSDPASDESDRSDKSDEICPKRKPLPTKINISVAVPSRQSERKRASTVNELKFVVDSDEYFRLGKTRGVTSNRTLSRLQTPQLPPDELRTLLSTTKASHEKPINALVNEYRRSFDRWAFTLEQGFSVLVYGVGSKRTLLNMFHQEKLADWPVVVCNGFFPSLTMKEIVDSILDAALGMTGQSSNLLDSIELIEQAFRSGGRRLAIIIHNLDGPCLRAGKHQEVLCRIARLKNVWLLASIDHVNSPSLWDQSMLSQYNFSYWDATTMVPYTDETSLFEGSLMVRRSGALVLSSLQNVFRSLTTNARGIFLVVVNYQLEKMAGGRQYAGMPFKDLYRRCREELLVSSDQILRAQLTEFLDHKLVVSRRGQGGSEMLTIPLDNSLLETFLEQRLEQDDG